MKDSQIQEKMESLDALSGGLVFGKEEAWERLQARMDKKPAVLYRFRYAALAAVLLVLISVGVLLNYHPQERLANSQPRFNPDVMPVNESESGGVADAQPELMTLSIPVTQEQTTLIEHGPVLNRLPKAMAVSMPVAHLGLPQLQPVSTDLNIDYRPKLNLSTMRVVHINDIDGGYQPAPEDMYAYDGPKLDISKMKVVSIYDLQQEERMNVFEEDILTIARINRPHGNLFTFQNPFRRNYNTGSRLYTGSPLNINFNRNN